MQCILLLSEFVKSYDQLWLIGDEFLTKAAGHLLDQEGNAST